MPWQDDLNDGEREELARVEAIKKLVDDWVRRFKRRLQSRVQSRQRPRKGGDPDQE